MIHFLQNIRQRAGFFFSKRARHTKRISRNSLKYAIFLGGAACVALVSIAFAWLAELMLGWNAGLTQRYWWSALLLLPFGFAGLRWLTLRFAPEARGSGIPQVIAAMALPAASKAQTRLVSLRQSMWKIVLTAGGLFAGASIGREGPSVQVGAAVMLAWGQWWHKKMGFRLGFRPEALIAAGAAGGLAAAFNTPLAGVVFAIEELGRGSVVRWDRVVMSAVLAAGFLTLALLGNHSYFHISQPIELVGRLWLAVIVCGLITGALGGMFAKTLISGIPGFLPVKYRTLPALYPIRTAFACGLLVALLGLSAAGTTYGTGYEQAAGLLNGHATQTQWFGMAKLLSTIASYFAGIPGGIFTPALAIGAGIGENIEYLLNDFVDPRLLVLLSMAGFLAAATQAPITASVIVMEMSGTHDFTLYLLAATLLASFVSRQFCPRPFYHTASRFFGRESQARKEDSKESSRTSEMP